ncbi:riboflavin-binding protein-like [Spea bombifrons]|uniref:riboflavin-binding protein-like n=1 Tax=Spea bombifrons TaxID=233779 RepID=UPI00234BDB72|nr:riboflavin-binding protein-like [Spea bombifrons]
MKLALVILVAGYFCAVSCQQSCLQRKDHKASPSPESGLHECLQYSESSCCYANLTEKLAHFPVVEGDDYYWDKCGNLSKSCEDYMKKLECFYQCSPLSSHWAHPNKSYALRHVPICQSFCDSWFEACQSDLICARNWFFDWIIDENGNHCKNECIPFNKMYANGTDLCQSAWDESFVVSSSPCRCLDMTATDKNVIKYILDQDKSEESSEKEACKARLQKPQDKKEGDDAEDD